MRMPKEICSILSGKKKDLMAARQRQSESIVMMVSEVEDKGYLMVLE